MSKKEKTILAAIFSLGLLFFVLSFLASRSLDVMQTEKYKVEEEMIK